MKLVDILARELKEWPHSGNALGQAADRTLHLNEYASHGGEFYGWTKEKFTRAEDHHEAFITRAQWQAAVDALKAEKVVEWNGDGLPPVGAVCEAGIPHVSGLKNETISVIWIECRVIAYHVINGKTYAWIAEDDGFYAPGIFEFRPIRAPEQIEADERDRSISEMREIWNFAASSGADPFIALHSAGYRKFEIVDN